VSSALGDILLQQLTRGDALATMSTSLGADNAATAQAVKVVVPLLVTALAKNAASPEGATALQGALERDHDGSLLDQIGGYLEAADTSPGEAILRHVLGSRQGTVATGVSKAAGVDLGLIQQLLPLVAPLVLAQLGRARRENNLDAGGLASVLAKEAQGASKSADAPWGNLGSLLDMDQDGDPTDDAVRVGAGLLGRLFGGRR